MLWLNTDNPGAFPEGLTEALANRSPYAFDIYQIHDRPIQERLRLQLRNDALQPLPNAFDESDPVPEGRERPLSDASFTPELLDEVILFLRSSASAICLSAGRVLTWLSQPQVRLERVLQYLRSTYHYCFWCGAEYKSLDELLEQCPGPDEESHD